MDLFEQACRTLLYANRNLVRTHCLKNSSPEQLHFFPGPKPIVPFLKWAGGKRWLTIRHPHVFPNKFNRYIEPFLGSACVFFYLRPQLALLGDSNRELIQTYKAIKKSWKKVAELLAGHHARHSTAYYYAIRSEIPSDAAGKAARFIYLNRACFNGIYRVNLQGIFNVPKGTKDTITFESDDFQSVARALKTTHLFDSDFQMLIDSARQDDFIFADPPYTVRHNSNGFVKYNEKLFSWQDQERLADSLVKASRRGAKFLVTNADHESVRQLYANHEFRMNQISRFSSISASGDRRGRYSEILISNF
jgi:DNA adenine methylase